jgi:hypothetical protein
VPPRPREPVEAAHAFSAAPRTRLPRDTRMIGVGTAQQQRQQFSVNQRGLVIVTEHVTELVDTMEKERQASPQLHSGFLDP